MNEPFGQADCESEVRSLKADYRELYFDETPFNEAALKSETYLIIGRRGSGKTALSHYFSFKKAFDDPIYIDVDEPALYQKFLSELAAQAGESRELAIYRLQRIWSYVVWTVILEHTRGLSADIERACEPKRPRRSVSEFINGLLQTLVEVFRDGDGDIGDVDLEGLFTSPMIKQVLSTNSSGRRVCMRGLNRGELTYQRSISTLVGSRPTVQSAYRFVGRRSRQTHREFHRSTCAPPQLSGLCPP